MLFYTTLFCNIMIGFSNDLIMKKCWWGYIPIKIKSTRVCFSYPNLTYGKNALIIIFPIYMAWYEIILDTATKYPNKNLDMHKVKCLNNQWIITYM